MAISATNLGTYTKRLALTGTNTNAAFATAIKNAITGVSPAGTTGWEIYDEFTDGVRITHVYRSLNEDGITYKNIIVRINTILGEINLSTCESWNNATHVATNEATCFANHCPIPFKTRLTDLLIFISPRYCAMMSVINNEISEWSGVFEMQREDANDTAAANYPCWGFISAPLWMLGANTYSERPFAGSYHTAICMPKTRNGHTAGNAAVNWSMDFGLMSIPPLWSPSGVGSVGYYLSSALNILTSTQWDTNAILALPVKPIHIHSTGVPSNYGKIFGMKVASPIANAKMLDKVPIKIDSEGDFYPTGTTNNHWVLPLSHLRYELSNMVAAYRPRDINILGQSMIDLVSVGDFVYLITTSNNIFKIDTLSGAVYNYTQSFGTYTDIEYDGERYIYIGTSSGLIKLDTWSSDSRETLSITNGVKSLSINHTHILTAPYNGTPTPVISRVDKNTFALDATLPTVTLTTFSESVTIKDIVCDGYGHFYLIATCATASNSKLVKITQAGVASYLTTSINNIALHVGLTLLDEKTLQVNQLTTTTNLRITYVNIAGGTTFSTITYTDTAISSGSYTPEYPMKTVKVNGLYITFVRCSQLYGVASRFSNTNDYPASHQSITALTGIGAGSYAGMFRDDNRLYMFCSNGLRIYEGVNEEIYAGTTSIKSAEILLPS